MSLPPLPWAPASERAPRVSNLVQVPLTDAILLHPPLKEGSTAVDQGGVDVVNASFSLAYSLCS